uniref:Uncharacterized protein n=1 Tax=Arundo donax TaxID=35708 RepID=A0A0A9F626_ARUDO
MRGITKLDRLLWTWKQCGLPQFMPPIKHGQQPDAHNRNNNTSYHNSSYCTSR